MTKRILVLAIALLAIFGLMVSCKNEVTNAGFGEELVSVSFKEDMARGLTATLEGFDKDHLYWAYAAEKADGSNLISGETDSYDESGAVWVKTDGYNKPVEGLGTTGTSGYEAYKVSGFSQGYWNFKLYAYKGVLGDNPATTEVETDYVTGYVLVYQGETLNVLLKSDSVNTQGSHLVSVIVDPIQSQDNGTMVFLTNKTHAATDRISMNTVNSAIYGTNYTVKVLSILSMEDFPVEYVDAAGAKIHEATDSQDGEYTLPAGSYKVTVAFTDSASAPTVNYAKGTIVATVYSNLTTTISGDLTEAMTYAEFDGELNPDLKTVTISSEAITYAPLSPSTQVSFSSTGTAKAVTATTTKAVTNQIILEIVATNGTNTTEYNQSLVLTLNVETVESTATTATYEIGMSATLTSSKSGDPDVVTTSDVSEVDEHVTIVLQLQPGLDDVNVLHDGHQMAEAPATDAGYGVFSYNKPTGELTIVTKSFSPFEVSFVVPSEADYVAQVGNLKFLTLADAIAKAASNSTVTLLKSITTDAVFNVINGRLDLDGHKITGTVTASANGAIVKNGSIAGILTASGNSALIEDLTVTGKISIGGTGAVLENCTVTGTGDYAVEVTAGDATIKSGTYKAAAGEKILNGSILVEDGNFKGTTLAVENAPVSLIGGIYEYDGVSAFVADGYECAKVSEGVYKVRKIVEARNITTETDYYFLQDAIDEAASGDVIALQRSIVDSETYVVGDDKNITLDLNGKTIETKLKSEGRHFYAIDNYGTLTLKDSSTGGKIKARGIENLGGKMTIESGTYYDIDTNGGAAVWNENKRNQVDGWFVDFSKYNSYSGDSHIPEVDADISELGITKETFDNDSYNYESSGYGWIMDDSSFLLIYNKYLKEEVVAELTVDGGSFIVDHVGSASDSSGPGGIYSGPRTKLTINAATINSSNLRTYALRANGTTVINGDADTVVVYGAHGALAVDTGSITVNGGSFSATEYYGCWITNDGTDTTAVINGGSFTGAYGLYSSVDDGGQDVSDIAILITGGTFTGTTGSAVINDKGTAHGFALVLKGGTYNTDPSAYVAPGYYADHETDSTWRVKQVPSELAVASVTKGSNTTLFLSLEDAIDYASDSDTVTLLKDISVDDTVLVTKSITFDGNEKTISRTLEAAQAGGCVLKFVGTESAPLNLIVKNLNVVGVNTNGIIFKACIQKAVVNDCSISTENRTPAYIGDGTPVNSVYVELNNTNMTMTGKRVGSPWGNTAIGVTYGATAIVTGGTYTGPLAAYIMSSGGKLKINEGSTFVSTGNSEYTGDGIRVDRNYWEVKEGNKGVDYSDSVLTINGGSFEGISHINLVNSGNQGDPDWDDKVLVYIKGGDFENYSIAGVSSPWCLAEITGGTFDADPSANVADGYYARNNGDGTWTVIPVPMDVRITKNNDDSFEPVEMTLAGFRNSVNSGNTYEGYTVTLLRDVNLEGINWSPIGSVSETNVTGVYSGNCFSGTFDGDNHSISKLQISNSSGEYQGFFGWLKNATVKKLTINDADVAVKKKSGILAALVDYSCVFDHVTIDSDSSISGESNIGGMVGVFQGREDKYIDIIACSVSADITATKDRAGGFFGTIYWSDATAWIIDSSVNGEIHGGNRLGGFVGRSSSSMTSSGKMERGLHFKNFSMTATIDEVTDRGYIIGWQSDEGLPFISFDSDCSYKDFTGNIKNFSLDTPYEELCHYYDTETHKAYFGVNGTLNGFETANKTVIMPAMSYELDWSSHSAVYTITANGTHKLEFSGSSSSEEYIGEGNTPHHYRYYDFENSTIKGSEGVVLQMRVTDNFRWFFDNNSNFYDGDGKLLPTSDRCDTYTYNTREFTWDVNLGTEGGWRQTNQNFAF